MSIFVYLNNSFIKESQAFISVKDRGFCFGDGVFETIRVANRKLYLWESHKLRMELGLKALKIDFDTKNILNLSEEIIERNFLTDGFVRIMISRGEGSTGYLPVNDIKTNLIIETREGYPEAPAERKIWVSSYRKISLSMLPVQYKIMQGLNSSLAKMEAVENGCFEALQLTSDSDIAECSSANIFWVKNNKLFTPSSKCNILNGVIRQRILDFSDIDVKEGIYNIDNILEADAVFITNVAFCVMSVTQIIPYNKKFDPDNKTVLRIKDFLTKDISRL